MSREKLKIAVLYDVFEEEPTPATHWADVPNISFTPHIGGAAREDDVLLDEEHGDAGPVDLADDAEHLLQDRKSTRLNSSHT